MGRPPKNAFAEQTTLRLLRAAEAEFGANGYRRARLADIAERAGIRRSSLLYHFGRKSMLYAEMVKRAFEYLESTVEASILAGPRDPEMALARLVDTLLSFAEARPAVVQVLLREMVDPSGTGEVLVAFARLIQNLEQAFREVAGERVAASFPVRAAIMQLISSYLLRSAVGDMAGALWGEVDHTHLLSRALLLGSSTLCEDER